MLSVDLKKYMDIFVQYVRIFNKRQHTVATFFLAVVFSLCAFNVPAQVSVPNSITPQPSKQNPYFNSDVELGNHQKKFYKACSVYVFIRSFLKVQIMHLSTFKVSSCPAPEFGQITSASVKAQLQTITPISLVAMYGPYYQLMDENNSVIENQSIAVGNLNFTQVMYAELTAFDLIADFKSTWRWSNGASAYNPIRTRKNMQFVWYKGSTIYTLTSPDGVRYVMVYFSPPDIDQFTDEQTVLDKLAGLGDALNMPAGWKYQAEVLTTTLRMSQIVAEGRAGDSLMDELDNVYVRIKAGVR